MSCLPSSPAAQNVYCNNLSEKIDTVIDAIYLELFNVTPWMQVDERVSIRNDFVLHS